MNDQPPRESDETFSGENVSLQEFTTTLIPATPEMKMRPRYNVPDRRWMFTKPDENGPPAPGDGNSPSQPNA